MASEPNYADLAQRYGPKIAQYLWKMYVQPAYGATTATSGAAAPTAGMAAEGTAGVSSGAGSGFGGLSAGGYATVAAPLVMAYLHYQAGSGVNEPVRKSYETIGAGKYLTDLANGQKVNPEDVQSNYGLPPKYLPDWMESGTGTQTIDPRGYTPYELYERMHSYATGHPQTGGLGNSAFTDPQVDELFGKDKNKVATLLGVKSLPDWSKYGGSSTGFDPNTSTPWSVNNPQVVANSGWETLDPAQKQVYENRAIAEGTDNAQNLWDKDQQIAEVEKLLGRKLR